MKQIGRVQRFDGYNGIIEVNGIEYLLLDKNIRKNEIVYINDMVVFVPEVINDVKVARFVKKNKRDVMCGN